MTSTALLVGSTGMLGERMASRLLGHPDTSLQLLVRSGALLTGLRNPLAQAHQTLRAS